MGTCVTAPYSLSWDLPLLLPSTFHWRGNGVWSFLRETWFYCKLRVKDIVNLRGWLEHQSKSIQSEIWAPVAFALSSRAKILQHFLFVSFLIFFSSFQCLLVSSNVCFPIPSPNIPTSSYRNGIPVTLQGEDNSWLDIESWMEFYLSTLVLLV